MAVRSEALLDPSSMRSTLQGNRGALLDLWILSECDELVLSAGSTFGRAARQRSSKTSIVATRLEGDEARAAAQRARLKGAAGLPGFQGARGAGEGQAACSLDRTRESCYFGWKNIFMGAEEGGGSENSIPGRGGAAHFMQDMRVSSRHTRCVAPDALAALRRFHADCSRS